jgi:primosomal protein N' (replication factor Y)
VQIGARRTAEEFGRAFAGVPVVLSSAEASHGVIAQVGSEPAVVVATPRAEPTAPGGYAAAALLDGWLTSAVGGLEASVLALGRWLAAACLVRPAAAGGVVALVGEPALRPAQALVRWDPQGLAARELAERQELGLPPSVILVAITGAGGLAEQFVATIDITKASFTILGPMPVDSSNQRCLLKTSLDQGRKLVQAVRAARARWYMASNPGIVRIEVDPEL